MGLFKKTIGKECRNPQCDQFQQLKPKESAVMCEECGDVMYPVTKANPVAMLVPLLFFVIIAGISGGLFGWRAYKTKKLAELALTFAQAVKESDLTTLEAMLPQIKKFAKSDQMLPFVEQVETLRRVLPERKKIELEDVSPGSYQISEYTKRYANFINESTVDVQQPFSVQPGEVTVGDFRQYAESLSDDDRQKLGTFWEKDSKGKPFADERPVENISWNDAVNYAKWLSQKTAWDLRLPTVQQWVAACEKFAEDAPVLASDDTDQPETQLRHPVDHLLGNLREWSSEQCPDGGYRLLGENYRTNISDPTSIGNGYCAKKDMGWTGVGFRLVKIEH